jgi:rRNA-processing protein EBP2
MAKSSKSIKKKSPSLSQKNSKVTDRITVEDIEAMSSEEDVGDVLVPADENDDNQEWNKEAMALRQAIADGTFDHLLKHQDQKDGDNDESPEEMMDELEASSDDDTGSKESEKNDSDSDEEKDDNKQQADVGNGKALLAVTQELIHAKKSVPWAETFDVMPADPLPFGAAGAPGNPLDVHDDLKRELAFYNLALATANEGRVKCREAKLPFSRPVDFFAEMVKTDGKMIVAVELLWIDEYCI